MDRNQRDILWLGGDGIRLGPLARAALGILMENREWAWWDDPSKTHACLEKAVLGYLPAKWAGDSSVMDADKWVDPLRALRLGQAFDSIGRRGRLKIKILRSVWGWPSGVESVKEITFELSRLVGSGHVFPEWEHDARPRFPASISPQGLSVITSCSSLSEKFIDDTQGYLEWVPDATVADIVVASSIEALYDTSFAKLVILYGENAMTEFADVSRLRYELCAQCVIYVSATEQSDIEQWLLLMSWSLEMERCSLSDAIESAEKGSGLLTVIVSSTQAILSRKSPFHGQSIGRTYKGSGTSRLVVSKDSQISEEEDFSLPDSLSSDFAMSDAQQLSPSPEDVGSTDNQSHLREAPFSQESRDSLRPQRPRFVRPAPPVERVLNARTLCGEEEVSEWPKEGVVDIKIDIRVKSPLHESRPSFPDDRVEWDENSKSLQVHMLEFGSQPQSRTLVLSRTGNSTIATFTQDVGYGSVDLRFLVSDGAQILQTARYQSVPGKKIHFFIENIVTPIHRAKEAFDVALLVNESLGNQPSLTVITSDGAVIFSPLSESETGRARERLLLALEQAVVMPDAPLEPLMLRLANKGSLLQQQLQSVIPDWPGSEARIQLVTQSDAFFPVEYLYDGKIPESTKAPLCAERTGCLQSGRAIKGCLIREAAEQLCPMGFLGVSGVIERHAWKSGQDARIWSAPGGSKPKRHRIEDLSSVAFAASDLADNFADEDVPIHQLVRIASIEASLGVKKIPSWQNWKDTLLRDSPSLLLLLVHLDDEQVFVGEDDGINLASIGAQYVGSARMVIAIGCSSGLGDIPGGSLPAILQRSGARVVIAAMTHVLGRHANRVGRDLAIRMKAAAISRTSTSVGEVISAIRRELLADGLALGLAVVAFGDADIVLGQG